MRFKQLKSIFLIVGTAIGAGILALPIATVACGFWGAALGLIVTWVFMTIAAYFMLQARLYFKQDVDLSTMSIQLLGKPLKLFIEVCYLSLLFALVAIYITVGSAWLGEILFNYSGVQLTAEMAQVVFTVMIGGLIFTGLGRLSTVNKIVTISMLLFLVLIIIFSLPQIEISKIRPYDMISIPATFPMLLTTFGFSIVLPSLATYLNNDKAALSKSLIVGSAIILVTYLAWILIAFGVIGGDGQGLGQFANSKDQGTEVINRLSQIVDRPFFNKVGFAFMFSALLSSVFGVGHCLFCYLKDTLPIKENNPRAITAILIGFLTPLVFINLYPAGITSILSFAGIFVAIILGIVPCAMVLSRKIDLKFPRILVYVTIAFFLFVIGVEVWRLLN